MPITVGTNTTVREPILAALTIEALRNKVVIMPWASTEYEGIIKNMSDTVSVQVFPTITHSTGTTAGGDIAESPFTITKEQLTVDVLKQANFRVGDYEQNIQTFALKEKLAVKLAEDMKITIDTAIAATAIAGAHASNQVATSVVTKTTVFDDIDDLAVRMDEGNAGEDRALFLPPRVASLLRRADLNNNTETGAEVRAKGHMGEVSGFQVMKSNNLPTGKFFAMTRGAVHIAVGFIGLKITDKENAMASGVVSEYLFGTKVFTPNNKSIAVKTYTLS